MSNRREMWDQRYRDRAEVTPGLPGFVLAWLDKLHDGRLLDLACGDGAVALNLPDRFTITAADFSDVALERLQQFAAQKALILNTAQVDFDQPDALQALGQFHSIIICRYKPSAALLSQLHRSLYPGGTLLIATFNALHHHETGFPARLTLQSGELSQLQGLRLAEYDDGAQRGEGIDVYLFHKPEL